LFKRKKIPRGNQKYKKISILIPARNEARFIKDTIESALRAKFNGEKEIILIDDSSTDNTYKIAKKYPITILKTKTHSGKALSLNLGLSRAKGDLIAVMDADSVIHEDALLHAYKYLKSKEIVGVTSTIKVKNRKNFLGMWLHIEQLYNSLLRSFFSKINANIVTPGPLSIYKKKALLNVGRFQTKGYSEDVDIAVKLIRTGKRIDVSEISIAETNMPVSIKGFIKQRTRFAKGWVHILKRHLQLNKTTIDLYSFPMVLFWFVQAVIMAIFISSQIFSGYITYFLSKGTIINFYVVNYFFEWFSIIGIVKWIYNIVIGNTVLDFFSFIGLITTLLSYPLYVLAILKYDKKIDLYHLLPLVFMFPYWFLIMIIYILNIGEWFSDYKLNKWEKTN
jgi:cellulose synthase/poly-beta-1,6-N-acetylglucosamine synthase-like glycosyltransferase